MNTIARTARQIGSAIRRYRRQQDLTQRALGDLMHARQATVSKLESGEPRTQLDVLIDALSALNLELVVQPRTKASADQIEELF
jgi:HTH-type transcriptional regulator/antitoxin HipB